VVDEARAATCNAVMRPALFGSFVWQPTRSLYSSRCDPCGLNGPQWLWGASLGRSESQIHWPLVLGVGRSGSNIKAVHPRVCHPGKHPLMYTLKPRGHTRASSSAVRPSILASSAIPQRVHISTV
jgi:hypothetical protein